MNQNDIEAMIQRYMEAEMGGAGWKIRHPQWSADDHGKLI